MNEICLKVNGMMCEGCENAHGTAFRVWLVNVSHILKNLFMML